MAKKLTKTNKKPFSAVHARLNTERAGSYESCIQYVCKLIDEASRNGQACLRLSWINHKGQFEKLDRFKIETWEKVLSRLRISGFDAEKFVTKSKGDDSSYYAEITISW